MAGDMRDVVAQALTVMRRSLPNGPDRIDPDLIDLWTLVLANAGLGPEEVRRATAHVVAHERFFPPPVKLIEFARPAENDERAQEAAWGMAVRCVQDYGGYASLHVSDVCGDGRVLWALERMGWCRLCEELSIENRALLRAEFVRWYLLARAGNCRAQYLVGRCEANNRFRGKELTPALCGRPDWTALPEAVQALPEEIQAALPR